MDQPNFTDQRILLSQWHNFVGSIKYFVDRVTKKYQSWNNKNFVYSTKYFSVCSRVINRHAIRDAKAETFQWNISMQWKLQWKFSHCWEPFHFILISFFHQSRNDFFYSILWLVLYKWFFKFDLVTMAK